LIKLRRETKVLSPMPQGNGSRGKLEAYADWGQAFLAKRDAATLDEIRAALKVAKGVNVHRASIGRRLHRLGLSRKKSRSKSHKR
jgi:transposase